MQIRLALAVMAAMVICGPAFALGTLPGDAERGEKLARQWCGSCHMLEGAKRAGDAAPTFREIARDPKRSADELRAFLSRPHPPMPPLALSRQEIEDLVAYLGYLKEH